MNFINNDFLKPIIEGEICGNKSRMLIDTGADYVVINVPKFKIKTNKREEPLLDKDGKILKERIISDAQYDKMIKDNYGAFVPDANGDYVKTVVHGFGDVTNECRLLILKEFSIGNYNFTDSYVLLDENGFATNHDMILGTSCLRNFELSINYLNKELNIKPITKELLIDYRGIISNDSNIINGSISLPSDIYLQEDIRVMCYDKDITNDYYDTSYDENRTEEDYEIYENDGFDQTDNYDDGFEPGED